MGATGFAGRFNAHREVGGCRRRHVGSQVDDDGASGVKPLERTLGAAQVHLLHVTGVAFMGQTTARKREGGRRGSDQNITIFIYKYIKNYKQNKRHFIIFVLLLIIIIVVFYY